MGPWIGVHPTSIGTLAVGGGDDRCGASACVVRIDADVYANAYAHCMHACMLFSLRLERNVLTICIYDQAASTIRYDMITRGVNSIADYP